MDSLDPGGGGGGDIPVSQANELQDWDAFFHASSNSIFGSLPVRDSGSEGGKEQSIISHSIKC
jgi:hypothetical protein